MVSEDDRRLSNLSRINILIGANNSGKSRFLRSLFVNTKIDHTSTEIDHQRHNEHIANVRTKVEAICKRWHVEEIKELPPVLFEEVDYLNTKSSFWEVKKTLNKVIDPKGHLSYKVTQPHRIRDDRFKSELFHGTWEDLHALPEISEADIKNSFRPTIYIPTLRGLRGINTQETSGNEFENFYLSRTVNDYFKDLKLPEQSIYTGLSLYKDVKKLLLGPDIGRKKIRAFERFISTSFFEGEEFNIIPNIDDNVVHVKIGDKEEYPVYELGDGIQAIIILTYPLFFRMGEPLNVCIEEPDLFLHPGFQRVFIETLCRKEFRSFQFFFTTHSNHFLDMTLDYKEISVYCFSKKGVDKFEIENVSNADERVLQEIGVRNSSVFLSNGTIWVEGITDRIYIRKYLELYQKTVKKKYNEDIHYSFVEYGGGNVTHWSFLDDADESHSNINVDRLCGKVFLIADSDGADLNQVAKTKKEKRLQSLKDELHDNFFCLKCREVENLLTKETRIKTVAKLEKKALVDLSFAVGTGKRIDTTPIGEWIQECIIGKERNYKAESGTVKDKLNFAKAAVSCMDNFSLLSEEAKELTKKLYQFIEVQNS